MLKKNRIAKPVQAERRFLPWLAVSVLGIASVIIITGCQTGSSSFTDVSPVPTNSREMAMAGITNTVSHPAKPASNALPSYILREGDTLNVSFPGSPSLNTVQQIRTDGKITLPLVGEVDAAGMSTAELQKKLVKLYAPLISSKQVTVEVQSSAFPVYVTGSVLRPGKVLTDHPLTALEAIMEAGGFNYTTANLTKVTVIRQEENQTKRYELNLKKIMNGGESKPFYLKPNDIIYVPERFTWF